MHVNAHKYFNFFPSGKFTVLRENFPNWFVPLFFSFLFPYILNFLLLLLFAGITFKGCDRHCAGPGDWAPEAFSFQETPLKVICLSGASVLIRLRDRTYDKLQPCLGFISSCFKEEMNRIL